MQGEGRGPKVKWLCNALKYGLGWRGESGGRDLSMLQDLPAFDLALLAMVAIQTRSKAQMESRSVSVEIQEQN